MTLARAQEGFPERLEGNLFHCSNPVDTDEKRQSMVLELYCRKAKREKSKEAEGGHGHMERGENGGVERKQENQESGRCFS